MVIFDTSIVTCCFTMRDGKIVQSSLDILSSIAVYEVTIRMSYYFVTTTRAQMVHTVQIKK
jgi:hypothetical protein